MEPLPRMNRRRLFQRFLGWKARLHSGRFVLLCGLLSLAAVGGCQREPTGKTWNLAPVEGTITKGGSPLSNILVVFLPDTEAGTVGPRASGKTDEDGHYRLRTDN